MRQGDSSPSDPHKPSRLVGFAVEESVAVTPLNPDGGPLQMLREQPGIHDGWVATASVTRTSPISDLSVSEILAELEQEIEWSSGMVVEDDVTISLERAQLLVEALRSKLLAEPQK
jgi:hypothetical protein